MRGSGLLINVAIAALHGDHRDIQAVLCPRVIVSRLLSTEPAVRSIVILRAFRLQPDQRTVPSVAWIVGQCWPTHRTPCCR